VQIDDFDRVNKLLEERTNDLANQRKKCAEMEHQLGLLVSYEVTIKEYEKRVTFLNGEIELWRERYS
jgi:hypothetical protein